MFFSHHIRPSVTLCALLVACVAVQLFAGPAAEAALVQLTTDGSVTSSSLAPSGNSSGSLIAFESNSDLTGANSDLNVEIFRVSSAGAVIQLTDSSGCTNGVPSSDAAGSLIAFESNCDPTGGNGDGSVEIFQVSAGGMVTQLTDGVGCVSEAPSSNASGDLVAFTSNCDHTGGNGDGGDEIFQASSSGTVVQLTDDASAGGCASFNPSSNALGDLVAFDSDCDLAASNPDEIREIFQVSAGGVVAQLTLSLDNACVSEVPASNAAGDKVAFESDCDFVGGNTDASVEVFMVDSLGQISQLSDDGASCDNGSVAIDGDGVTVVFTRTCVPAPPAEPSQDVYRYIQSSLAPVAAGVGCPSTSPWLSGDGLNTVFESGCDFVATNGDGGIEIFAEYLGTLPCNCGAPISLFAGGSTPTASDALFTLRAAVGSESCLLCDCDVNNDGSVSSVDALTILKAAVGQDAVLTCP
ncbi:MAG: hypothetical protein ACE5E4_05385 [Candidatus Binatia bacterium]